MHLSRHYAIVLEGCISLYITLLYWRDASLYCIGGMHLSIHYAIVLEGCISIYITLLYWRDASLNTFLCDSADNVEVSFLSTLTLADITDFYKVCLPPFPP